MLVGVKAMMMAMIYASGGAQSAACVLVCVPTQRNAT